jgi:hypothetical protein
MTSTATPMVTDATSSSSSPEPAVPATNGTTKKKERKPTNVSGGAAKPKKETKKKEKVPAPVVDEDDDTSKNNKKSRQVQRFNVHEGKSFLNLRRYWNHHDCLRTNWVKFRDLAAGVTFDKDDDTPEKKATTRVTAAAKEIHYAGSLERLVQRRADAVKNVELTALLLKHLPASQQLVTKLLTTFEDDASCKEEDAKEDE